MSNNQGPDFKDQARSVLPGTRTQRTDPPKIQQDGLILPDFKDQHRSVEDPNDPNDPSSRTNNTRKARTHPVSEATNQSPQQSNQAGLPLINAVLVNDAGFPAVPNPVDPNSSNPVDPSAETMAFKRLKLIVVAVLATVVVIVGGVVGAIFGLREGSTNPTENLQEGSTNPTKNPDKKVFVTTSELYEAVDRYMVDKSLTSEYGATINDWDVSRIRNFDRLFDANRNQKFSEYNSASFDFSEDLSQWNTSSAESMVAMFFRAEQFNGNITTWDVRSVTTMAYMFLEAHAFDQPIGNWNVGSVTSMSRMFREAHSFNRPIGNWDVSSVTDTRDMFGRAYAFNQDIGNWDVSSMTYLYAMFSSATSFNQSLCDWLSRLPSNADVSIMFRNTACPNTTLVLPNGPMCHVCI